MRMFVYAASIADARASHPDDDRAPEYPVGRYYIPGLAVADAARATHRLDIHLPEYSLYYDRGGKVRRLGRDSVGVRQADITDLYDRLCRLYAGRDHTRGGLVSLAEVRSVMDDILTERRAGAVIRSNTPVRELPTRDILDLVRQAPHERRELPHYPLVRAQVVYMLTRGHVAAGDLTSGSYGARIAACAWLGMWCSTYYAEIVGELV